MKVLIPADDIVNGYIPSLVNAYQNNGCEVFIGAPNFFQSEIIPDILHLQWPESLYKFGDFSIYGEVYEQIKKRFAFYKVKGAKVIWTIHNLEPHEKEESRLGEKIFQLFEEYADVIVHHGKASIRLSQEKFPKFNEKVNILCPHGDYLIQDSQIDKVAARTELNLPLNKNILLHFGVIRGYKGYEILPKVFNGWKKADSYLLTAGVVKEANSLRGLYLRFWKGRVRNRTKRFGYDIKRIPNQLLAKYFIASDIVILTHKKGLTSGIIPLACTFKKPLVYPNIGNFEEQTKGWIAEPFTPGSIKSAIDALNRLSSRLKSNTELDNEVWLENNSWDRHVKTILKEVD